jgi:hypothetical protein
LSSTIHNAIASQIKTSLNEAASTAEGAVGNNSHAVAAHIEMTNGYLTYCVAVLGPDMNINRVIIDPANGKVLLKTAAAPWQSMMMGRGPGMMGPGMMGPGMMGPGMMGMGPGMKGMVPEMMGMGPEMMGMGPEMMW